MVYSLLKESTQAPAEDPKLSVKGTSPADMDTGKPTNPSAISQVDLPLLLSFCFHQLWVSLWTLHPARGSGSLPLMDSWFWTLLWWPQAGQTVPNWSGPRGELWFQHHLTQASKDQICAKEKSSLWVRAGGWQLSVGEWRTSLWEGSRDRGGGCNWKVGRKRRFQK